MAAYDPATQGVKASAAMILTYNQTAITQSPHAKG